MKDTACIKQKIYRNKYLIIFMESLGFYSELLSLDKMKPVGFLFCA
ncbi:hypothetical protein AR1Y2_3443 [Anaerostipes rhamnosivorans]|uniref:Uncharacterized protein n=1 Tax=Anaerostipes rhamnosivorans TaxID=1229621 RepID=A0A4P8IJ03_9FIRM|nr:hypothetical protein AR1Y2_3443 [Anaerostipes rhamnosivorans]